MGEMQVLEKRITAINRPPQTTEENVTRNNTELLNIKYTHLVSICPALVSSYLPQSHP